MDQCDQGLTKGLRTYVKPSQVAYSWHFTATEYRSCQRLQNWEADMACSSTVFPSASHIQELGPYHRTAFDGSNTVSTLNVSWPLGNLVDGEQLQQPLVEPPWFQSRRNRKTHHGQKLQKWQNRIVGSPCCWQLCLWSLDLGGMLGCKLEWIQKLRVSSEGFCFDRIKLWSSDIFYWPLSNHAAWFRLQSGRVFTPRSAGSSPFWLGLKLYLCVLLFLFRFHVH